MNGILSKSTKTWTLTAPTPLTAPAAPKDAADPKNRVRDFFYEDHASVGKNRWASRLNTQEKSCYHYETASGRSNWPNRDPIGERGGINLYHFLYNEPLYSIDYLVLDARYGPYTDDNDRRRNSDELEGNGLFPPGPDNSTHGSEQREQSDEFYGNSFELPLMPNYFTPCLAVKCKEPCNSCCATAFTAGGAWIARSLIKQTRFCGTLANPWAVGACSAAASAWALQNTFNLTTGLRDCAADCNSKPSQQ